MEDDQGSGSTLKSSIDRSLDGAYATTIQAKLHDTSGSKQANDNNGEPSSMEHFEMEADSRVVATLQPADVGFGAWSYASAAFAMYIVVWGFPQAFPIFTTYLTAGKEPRFPNSIVLTLLAPGFQDVEEGFLFHMLPKSSFFRRPLVISGIAILIASLFFASLATQDWQIFVFQGVVFGIGGVMLNFVHMSIFPEWFEKRQGQAMGFIWLGFRFGSLGFPVICQWLLDQRGYTEAIQVLIAPMLALLLPSVILLRGRYGQGSATSASPTQPISKLQLLRKPKLFFYLVIAMIFDLVNNVPDMFIMSYGSDIGLTGSQQATALSLLNFSAMLSTYGLGWLSDFGQYDYLIAGSAISTSLCHFLVWGFTKDKLGIFTYTFIVGLTIGGFRNAFFTFFDEISQSNPELYTSVHALFSLVRGIAIVSVGPVGLSLLRVGPEVDITAYALGKYRYLVLYSGGIAMIVGVIVTVKIVLYPPNRKINLTSY